MESKTVWTLKALGLLQKVIDRLLLQETEGREEALPAPEEPVRAELAQNVCAQEEDSKEAAVKDAAVQEAGVKEEAGWNELVQEEAAQTQLLQNELTQEALSLPPSTVLEEALLKEGEEAKMGEALPEIPPFEEKRENTLPEEAPYPQELPKDLQALASLLEETRMQATMEEQERSYTQAFVDNALHEMLSLQQEDASFSLEQALSQPLLRLCLTSGVPLKEGWKCLHLDALLTKAKEEGRREILWELRKNNLRPRPLQSGNQSAGFMDLASMDENAVRRIDAQLKKGVSVHL